MPTKFQANPLIDFEMSPEPVFPHALAETEPGRLRIVELVSTYYGRPFDYRSAVERSTVEDLEWYLDEATGRLAIIGYEGTAFEELGSGSPFEGLDALVDTIVDPFRSSLRAAMALAYKRGANDSKKRFFNALQGEADALEREFDTFTKPSRPASPGPLEFSREAQDGQTKQEEIREFFKPGEERRSKPTFKRAEEKVALEAEPPKTYERGAVKVSFNGREIEGASLVSFDASSGRCVLGVEPPEPGEDDLLQVLRSPHSGLSIGYKIVDGESAEPEHVSVIPAAVSRRTAAPKKKGGPLPDGVDVGSIKMKLIDPSPGEGSMFLIACGCGNALRKSLLPGETMEGVAREHSWKFVNGWHCGICVRKTFDVEYAQFSQPVALCGCGAWFERKTVEGLEVAIVKKGWPLLDGEIHCPGCAKDLVEGEQS